MGLGNNEISSGKFLASTNEITDRLKLERELVERVKKFGERWPDHLGKYQEPEHSLLNQRQLPPHLLDEFTNKPPTFHTHLKTFINTLLRTKPLHDTVVALDIGGGTGSTWRTIANDFKEEIEKGRVALIVSNLALSLSPEEPLVHYINSTFRKLCGQSVTLPNGKVLPLRGNVDIAHESQSLSRWSQVPELDILSLVGLLSQHGIYFIAQPGKPCRFDLAPDPTINQNLRQGALDYAHHLLQNRFGLRQITEVEDGKYAGTRLLYRIFKKPAAPLISI